jgi:HAD superfamily hydrolase (TIGR01450 family)
VALADSFDSFLVDLDGVVWLGEEPIKGAEETLHELQRGGKWLRFLTNDPRESRERLADRLRALGLSLEAADVFTAATAVAALAAKRSGGGRTSFVIGAPALRAEVAAAGLRVLDGERGREADVVIVAGHDGFDHAELRIAMHALWRGAELYGAGRDPSVPTPSGPWPGSGAVLAAVEYGSGRRGITAGKPEPHLFELARRSLPHGDRTAMVGDRLDSDVAGARRAGLPAILVLTGSTRREDLDGAAVPPDHVIASLPELVL